MPSPSLQLDVEKTLAAFLSAAAILPDGFSISCAHAREKLDTTGNYLGIIADAPDWETLIINAEIKVTFEIVSAGLNDHEKAPAISGTHAQRVGSILNLFADQNFESARAALNAGAALAHSLGFTGWEALPPAADGTSADGAQLIARLSYGFQVFLLT